MLRRLSLCAIALSFALVQGCAFVKADPAGAASLDLRLESTPTLGAVVPLAVSIDPAGAAIVSFSIDLLYRDSEIEPPTALPCTIDARLAPPPDAPPNEPGPGKRIGQSITTLSDGTKRLRIGVFGFNVDPISAGPAFKCNFRVKGLAGSIITINTDKVKAASPAATGVPLTAPVLSFSVR